MEGRHRSGALIKTMVGLLAGAFVVLLMVPSTAFSLGQWSQYYCSRLLQPGASCTSNGPHSLYYNASAYPGAPSDRVTHCVYIYNSRENEIRGGVIACRRSDSGDGVARVQFGPTYSIKYFATAYLDPGNCCAHTIDAYTETYH
jgi:hypothetical protein